MSPSTNTTNSNVAALVQTAKGSVSMMKQLPKGFQPGPRDVICQRGKSAYKHNQHLREMVQADYQERYSNASSRFQKSLVVSDVVDAVRKNSPDGGFVRCVDGVYYEVGDTIAREKCGSVFREILNDRYRSSSSAKKRLREQRKASAETGSVASSSDDDSLQSSTKRRRVQKIATQSSSPATVPSFEAIMKDISLRREELSQGTSQMESEPASNAPPVLPDLAGSASMTLPNTPAAQAEFLALSDIPPVLPVLEASASMVLPNTVESKPTSLAREVSTSSEESVDEEFDKLIDKITPV